MPIITRFYGIIIKMYFNDHLPPHFHAIYGEYNGVFDINTLEMTEGDLPNRAVKLIREWAELHQNELMKIWEKKVFKKLDGLK
ncbi:hypothetical protein CLTEP_06260 [Clostridium tepidiprofundi DSM 19306]|uniref:DUF4160 domain-containing protein n=1 Tax=Clostridium tepidiprofundi DSM 19306 TaxID=1121338 RepID=A0A151B6P2_9CLOT|nr:DUF4160 domain-containing protein [Clostridium tepidiprofundi]KYH35450.1 hypothetical protein CLTEP_06260 [Clostridium tepidiprofundi DSM 19306]